MLNVIIYVYNIVTRLRLMLIKGIIYEWLNKSSFKNRFQIKYLFRCIYELCFFFLGLLDPFISQPKLNENSVAKKKKKQCFIIWNYSKTPFLIKQQTKKLVNALNTETESNATGLKERLKETLLACRVKSRKTTSTLTTAWKGRSTMDST